MARPVLLLAIAGICALPSQTALGARLAKRQSCNVADLPETCRPIFDQTIDTAGIVDSNFISTYCGETCGEPLYDYFKNCEPDTNNATMFDFNCASNSAGDPCRPSIVTLLLEDDSFFTVCQDFEGTECSSACEAALTSDYGTLGCCLYSYYAISIQFYADLLFSQCLPDIEPEVCVGGVSGQPLVVEVDVDPACEEFVEDVDQSCRRLLSTDVVSSAYFSPTDELCGASCGPQVYEFYGKCDERTGFANATALDVLCAVNSHDTFCAQVISNLTRYNLDPCEEIAESSTCPTECKEGIEQGLSAIGCCLPSLIQLFTDDFAQYAELVSSLCSMNVDEKCVGHFTGKPAPPAPPAPPSDDECDSLAESLPEACRVYTSFIIPFSLAYTSSAEFKTNFCDGPCSEVVYEYFVECDKIKDDSDNDAVYLDFLCSVNDRNIPCAGILSDTSLTNTLEGACDETTDTMCSEECSRQLVLPSQTWSCCLFTFTAFDYNVTYVSDIVEECGLDVERKVCIGGLSGKPVAAPGQPTAPTIPDSCTNLRDAISDDCADFSDPSLIVGKAFSDPSEFLTAFCQKQCAKQVFDFVSCVNKTEATQIDFLCSESSSGTDCALLTTNEAFNSAVEGVCKDATDKQCSLQCQQTIRGVSEAFGCCLYSYTALDTNVTYTNALYAQCGVDNPGLCTGGISNEELNAPGSETESGAVSNTFTAILLLICALATLV